VCTTLQHSPTGQIARVLVARTVEMVELQDMRMLPRNLQRAYDMDKEVEEDVWALLDSQ
jgi:hypothetical protein